MRANLRTRRQDRELFFDKYLRQGVLSFPSHKPMKRFLRPLLPLFLVPAPYVILAQTGPFNPEAWPPTIDINKTVHYVVTDGGLDWPGGFWNEGLSILSGGRPGYRGHQHRWAHR